MMVAENTAGTGYVLPEISKEKANEILTEIQSKWNDGKPYARANNTGPRWVVKMMQQKFQVRKRTAEEYVHSWWQHDIIEEDIVNKKTKMKGLKVKKMV